jgi:hypothetical protein
LTIDAYPGVQPSTLVLKEEDRDTTLTLSEEDCGGRACTALEIGPSARGFVVRMLTDLPARVRVDGRDLPGFGAFAALQESQSGWFYDAAAGRLWVRFATAGSMAKLEVVR